MGDIDIVQNVIKTWKETGSLRQTSRETGVTYQRVRRILIESGTLTTDRDRQIAELAERGKSREEIAAYLGVQPRTVDAHMPYRRSMYTGDSHTTKWRRKKGSDK